MAKIWMNDKVGRDKFDPYKDTLVTTVRGTAEEVKEVLDKLMGGKTNMPEYKTMSMCGSSDYCRGWNDAVKEMPKWISVKERMPAKGEKVLLYIPEREGCKQHGMYLGEVEKVEADPKGEHNFWGLPVYGSDWRISGWSFFEEPIVTHWMLMPDAPEVEDE